MPMWSLDVVLYERNTLKCMTLTVYRLDVHGCDKHVLIGVQNQCALQNPPHNPESHARGVISTLDLEIGISIICHFFWHIAARL